ncbi:MAG TPA: ABC transporter permease subunit [Roseiflexaceae bacterium]|nr:ABC transporter permease subunit [Roseiflexaceae bacterium]
MSQSAIPRSVARPPFWRDVRVLTILGQVVFVFVVALIAAWLYGNVTSGMRRIGIGGGYRFMNQTAGFEIGVTPIAYSPNDSYWRAFLVGLFNTLSVTIIGIILATILGVIVGVAQLSSNWLIARIAQTYVAIFRNTPLLVQLFFWYLAIFLQMPRVQQAIALPGPIYLSNRGVAMIGVVGTQTLQLWLAFLLGGLIAALATSYGLKRRQVMTGRSSPRLLIALAMILVAAGLGWLLVGAPLTVTAPVRRGFNFQGGVQVSPEYAALLVGLVIYTGTFIAENVRAGIQGIPQGQKEAARALGLSAGQSMRLVILPQALRIIIPPTTSQYLNLAKNSSLAIAIGFPDLFNVARTISNQTGQVVQMIGLIMFSYLAISLTTSLLMNLYNRRVRLVER